MTRTHWYWVLGIGAAAVIALIVLVVACGGGDDDDDDDGDETPTAEETAGTETADATEGPTDEPTAPEPTTPSGAAFEGTTGVTEEGTANSVIYTLTEVRIGEQEGYDRIVFEFEEPPEEATSPLPSYRIEYFVPPISGCASGIPAEIEGGAILSVKMRTAVAHDDQGNQTIETDEILAALTSILEAEQTCDFEGLVEWGVGAPQQLGYRVLELEGPPRLVVDILH